MDHYSQYKCIKYFFGCTETISCPLLIYILGLVSCVKNSLIIIIIPDLKALWNSFLAQKYHSYYLLYQAVLTLYTHRKQKNHLR